MADVRRVQSKCGDCLNDSDGGYSNAEEVARCERENIEVAAPIKRGAMNSEHFRPVQFLYDEDSDTIRCPGGQTPVRNPYSQSDDALPYLGLHDLCVEAEMHAGSPAHNSPACRSRCPRSHGGPNPCQSQLDDDQAMHGRASIRHHKANVGWWMVPN